MGNSNVTITIDAGLVDSWYATAVNQNFLPDVVIDESLKRFSFDHSDNALQLHFSENLAKADASGKLPMYLKT